MIYTRLYITYSEANMYMYYKFKQKGTNLVDIIEIYKGNTVNYQFASVPLIYREMNVVIMPHYIAL